MILESMELMNIIEVDKKKITETSLWNSAKTGWDWITLSISVENDN